MANQSFQAGILTLFQIDILTQRILAHPTLVLFRLLLCLFPLVTAVSASGAAGPLTINTSNPRYFFNSSGEAVYLAGASVNEYNLLNGPSSFSAHLDLLQQQNHNFTRLWAWEQSPWFLNETGQISFTSQPYERTGPGSASDGGLKFDLTRFNQAYFDQLRSRAIEAGERGIYVSVMLFEGFSSQKKVRQVNPWLGDPFELRNNINAIDGDPNRNGGGEEFFSLAFPSIVTLQEAFVRKVVDTLNDLDNVLYEVSGNGLVGSLSWQYHMVGYIKTYQRSKANQHPVGISQFKVAKLRNVLNSSADWIVLPATDTDPDPGISRGDKIIFVEPNLALLKSPNIHQWVWRRFVQGYNLIYAKPAFPKDLFDGRLDTALGQSISYSDIVNLASMSPTETLCSNDNCLVDPAVEYLSYLPKGGALKIDLSSSPEIFVPSWFSPATGEAILGDAIFGGKAVRLTSPLHGESILHLVRELAMPTANSAASLEKSAESPMGDQTASLTRIVATPVITPNGGIYAGQVLVTLKTTTPAASIHYTTDGQSPTDSSRKYTGPFTLSSSALVKAKAFKNNMQPSAEVAVWFSNASARLSFTGVLYLTWTDRSDNEDGVRIERLINGRVDKTLTVGPGITSYMDSGLVNGTIYCYRVRAFNSAGESDPSNEACSVPIGSSTN